MKNRFQLAKVGVVVAILLLSGAQIACKKLKDPASAEALAEETAAEEEAQAEPKPAPKPQPKVTDDLYIEITARSILIREKTPDDPDQAESEIEKLYEHYGVTMAEVRAFSQALVPPRSAEIQRKIQEKLQVLMRENR